MSNEILEVIASEIPKDVTENQTDHFKTRIHALGNNKVSIPSGIIPDKRSDHQKALDKVTPKQ